MLDVKSHPSFQTNPTPPPSSPAPPAPSGASPGGWFRSAAAHVGLPVGLQAPAALHRALLQASPWRPARR